MADKLSSALDERGKAVWLDLEDIVAGADWEARIKRGIEACKAFVFVLSPDSLSSPACRKELEQATTLHKLIIPIYHREIDEAALPAVLADREWLFLRAGDSFDDGVRKLVEALETDLEWRDEHTRLAGRTREWLDSERDRSFLLRGSDLRDAESWLAQQSDHRQAATAGQAEYIVHSRRAANARQRTVTAAVAAALLITAGLAVFAVIQRNEALDQKQLAVARERAVASNATLSQDSELSLLLAMEAVRTRDTVETADALRDALATVHLRSIVRVDEKPVHTVAYRADGAAILTASDDGRVRLWQPGAQTPIGVLVAGPPGETHAAFAGRGRSVLTTNERAPTRLWDTTTRRVVRTLPDRRYGETSAAVSADRSHIVTVARDGTARLWTSGEAKPRLLRAPSQEWIQSAAISPDGRTVATAPDGGRVRLWSIARPDESRALPESGPTSFNAIDFTADGRAVIAADEDGGVEGWDARGRRSRTVIGDTGGTLYPISALSARVNQKASLLAAGRSDGTLVVKDLAFEGRDFVTPTAAGKVLDVALAPDGETIATAGEDGTVRTFSVRLVDTLSAVLRGAHTSFNDATFSPDGRHVAGADTNGTVHLWTRDGNPVWTMRMGRVATDPTSASGVSEPARRIAFSRDGRWLAVAGSAGTAVVSVASSRPLLRLPGSSTDAEFSADGKLLAIAGRHEGLELRELPSGHVTHTLGPRDGALRRVAFSPDGKRLVTVGESGVVRVWNRDDKPAGTELGAGSAPTVDAEFSPDGRSVALAHEDGSLAIKDLDASAEPHTATVGTESLSSVTWSRSGRRLLVASGDGKATVLDAARLLPLATFVTSGESLTSASFDPRARSVALAGDDTTVRIFHCDLCGSTQSLMATARSVAARRLTRAEAVRYLHEPTP